MQEVETAWESRLDAVVLMQLYQPPPRDADDTFVDLILEDLGLDEPEDIYYAAYQLTHDPLATTEFVRVRDTSHDHVETVKFPYAEVETQPVVKSSAQFTSLNALPIPMYSAPFARVDLEALAVPAPVAYEQTEMLEAPRSYLFETIFVLTCALFLGMAVVYYAVTR